MYMYYDLECSIFMYRYMTSEWCIMQKCMKWYYISIFSFFSFQAWFCRANSRNKETHSRILYISWVPFWRAVWVAWAVGSSSDPEQGYKNPGLQCEYQYLPELYQAFPKAYVCTCNLVQRIFFMGFSCGSCIWFGQIWSYFYSDDSSCVEFDAMNVFIILAVFFIPSLDSKNFGRKYFNQRHQLPCWRMYSGGFSSTSLKWV